MQVMYARMEEADALIESLMQDKDPNLRQSGMYTVAMAYCGTGNNKAIKRLLHVAVRIRGCRFFHVTLSHNCLVIYFKKYFCMTVSHDPATHSCINVSHTVTQRSCRTTQRNGVARECYTLRCCLLELQGNAFGHLLVIVHCHDITD